MAEQTFPGWQSQSNVHATIKRDLILELAKYAKKNPDVKLSPGDFSKFSREALKYVEKYY